MFYSKTHLLTIACCIMVVGLFATPQDCLAGCGCAAPAAVGYAAPYVTSYATPITVGYAPAPAYMPTVVYRALYRPAPVVAYSPVVGYSGYAVTAYRPAFSWGSSRLVPYTTYRTAYSVAPVMSYSVGYAPYATYSPCTTCSPCNSGCGSVIYDAPVSSGCSSCAVPASPTIVSPTPEYNGGTVAPPASAAPQNSLPTPTFQQETQKPAVAPTPQPAPQPIPQTETKPSSTQSPLLPDPQDRTAIRTTYSAARVDFASLPTARSQTLSDDGWMPAKD